MDELTFVNNKQEMANFAKVSDNLGRWITFKNTKYIKTQILNVEPVKSILINAQDYIR